MSNTGSDIYERILVFDGVNLLIRSFSVVPILNENGDHIGMIYGAISSLCNAISKFNPHRVFFCWEGKGGSARRRHLYPDYKTKRHLSRITGYSFFSNVEDERASMVSQFIRFKEYLDCLPVYQISVDGLEADDVIAYISNVYDKNRNKNIIIVSTDKDFAQLLSHNTILYDPIKDLTYDVSSIKLFISENISPQNWGIVKAIIGDRSDNVKGIKGVGIKGVVNLFPEVSSENKILPVDIEKICQERASNNSASKKYFKILNNIDTVYKNYEIVQLYSVNITVSQQMEIQNIINKHPNPFNRYNLLVNFRRDSFGKYIKYFERFLDVFSTLEGKTRLIVNMINKSE